MHLLGMSKPISSCSKSNQQPKVEVNSMVWYPSQDGVSVSFSLLPLPQPHWRVFFQRGDGGSMTTSHMPSSPFWMPWMLPARRSYQMSVKDGSSIKILPLVLAGKTSAMMLVRQITVFFSLYTNFSFYFVHPNSNVLFCVLLQASAFLIQIKPLL